MLLWIPFIMLIAVLILLWRIHNRKVKEAGPMSSQHKILLKNYVPFYRKLSDTKKHEFETRAQQFLIRIKITGVHTNVEDLDRILIASSAIIPIFNFKGWDYYNLHEVLLYPDSFDHDFIQHGGGRGILGMVGSGALNHMMILSQQELRNAFFNQSGKDNVAIHEFVHLLDKTDGSIDGVPEFLLDQRYVFPWLQLMREEIEKIRNNESDINPYAGTSESEFFAVVSEYFFERPELLKVNHPELYVLLQKIFHPAHSD